MSHGITVILDELPTISKLESVWQGLERRYQPSFFTSWSWIGTWLSSLPEQIRPLLMRVEDGGEIIGLAIFVQNYVTRHKFLRSKGLYLHATGDASLDELFIEHNGFLVDPARREEVVAACVYFFVHRFHEWEEIFFDGIIQPEAYLRCNIDRARMIIRKQSTCHFVDLEKIRENRAEYLSCLSSNTRYQIRRTIMEYEKLGQVGIMPASSSHQAINHLSDMETLHQAHWESKGVPGSFSNPFFLRFHELLIRRCFDKGEIQLLRVYAGPRTVGYLYNFVMEGRVYYYQSGFDYHCVKKHNRPGLMAHALAIQYNIQRKARVYDMLAGDSQYKRSLGTDSVPMAWLVLQRNKLKFRLEHQLQVIKRRIVASDASV